MRLAGFLKMTLEELMTTMSSREFAYWQAYHRHFEPVGGEWEQTGLVAAASIAPYCPRGNTPQPQDFVPVTKPPQHQSQIDAVLRRIRDEMEG
jgi:hypothetical protein